MNSEKSAEERRAEASKRITECAANEHRGGFRVYHHNGFQNMWFCSKCGGVICSDSDLERERK